MRPHPLEARAITKAYPGTLALAGVDFTVERGQVHALIGENGAGKSTLVHVLGGITAPTSGTLILDGEPIELRSVRDATSRGIRIIHQELQLFPNLSVAENLFVGLERLDRWGLVDRRAQADIARSALARLGQTTDPDTLAGDLPLGVQQLVEIARALVHDTRILMMDEPTSALTASEIHTLFKVIRDLAAAGVSVVYISHRLEELLDVADRVTVLRDGLVVGDAASSDIDVGWIVERMTGRASRIGAARSAVAPGAPLLSVSGLRLPAETGRSLIDDVSFEMAAGEVVGIYGLMGAGRTELFESLLGIHPDASGRIELDGHAIDRLETSERVAAGLVMVPEDRQAAGLVQTLSVTENITLSSLDRIARHGYLSPADESREVVPFVQDLRIKTPALDAPITALSGGNQQKVVIARGLMSRPRVLLMDEPTRGVDVAAKAEIIGAMRRLAAGGLGVILASSDLGEVLEAADRTLVMAKGRIAAEFGPGEATEDRLASAASSATGAGRG